MDDVKYRAALQDGTAASDSLARIAQLAARVTGAPWALASIVGPDEHCVLGACGTPAEFAAGTRHPLRISLCSNVVRTEQELVFGDALADSTLAGHAAVNEGVRAYAGIPLRDHTGTVVGALAAIDLDAREWTEDQLAGLRDLAECASTQLSYAGLARDREQARAELESQTAFQNAVLESLNEGVLACGADGRIAYVNQALRSIHEIPSGPDAPYANGPSIVRLYTPDGARALEPDERPLARAYAGEQVANQHVVIKSPTGADRHYFASGSPVVARDGSTLGATVALHEVTGDIRRRRMRSAQLAIATRLANSRSDADAIGVVLTTLRDVLAVESIEYMELGSCDLPPSPVVARAVVEGALVQGADTSDDGYAVAVPISVGENAIGVLLAEGPSPELADELTASVVGDVAVLVGRWREQQRIEVLRRDLAEARQALQKVVEQVNDFVFSYEMHPDGTGRRVFATNTRGILGANAPDKVDWDDFFASRVAVEDRAEVARWRADIQAGRTSQLTCRIRGYDDVTRWIWTRSTLRTEGGRRFVDGISMDVSERQALTLEREELLEARKEQVQQLQALDRAKDEFVATVAHEIRGPLGLLVTFAEDTAVKLGAALPDDATGQSLQRKADLVLANAEHLAEVVENIFDIARLDAGGAALRKQDLAAEGLLRALAEQYAGMADERDVTLDVSGEPDLAVHADASRLRQALENLVSNAVKYSRPGGKVTLRSTADADGATVFTVTDDGIGIPEDDLPNLFTRFYRASNARSSDTPGTGLGLAVTQTVARAHGGSVEVRSATSGPEIGTTFTLRLPAVAPA